MIFTILALSWIFHQVNPILFAPDVGSPVNRTLEQSCPPGTFLFGSLQDGILDIISATSRNPYDGLSASKRKSLLAAKCDKILIHCSLRTIAISLLYCCPEPQMRVTFNGNVQWNQKHLEVVIEKDVFYLQGCLEHLEGIATRGRFVILKEHYRELEAKECRSKFEFAVQRNVRYLTMQFVAMLFLLCSVGICCISLMIFDGIHFGLEPACSYAPAMPIYF